MPKNKAVPQKRSPVFFSARNLDEMSSDERGPDAVDLKLTFDNEADKDIFLSGSAIFASHMKSFASDFDDSGLHIGVVEFAPGLVIPVHSHSDNCVYYVERGSVIVGNREIGPGEGFLTRKNQPYGFVVGPEGLRLIEFTTAPRQNIAFHDRNAAAWKTRLEKAIEKLETA